MKVDRVRKPVRKLPLLGQLIVFAVAAAYGCGGDGVGKPESCEPDPPLAGGSLTYVLPSWSVDNRIVYSDLGGRFIDSIGTYVDSCAGVWIFEIHDGSSTQVVRWARTRAASWSADGTQIVISRMRSLWTYSLPTGEIDALVDDGSWNHPGNWSPCNSSIVYASDEGAVHGWTLWRIDPRSHVRERLLDPAIYVIDPHWLAGCDSVVFGVLTTDYVWNIMWLDIETLDTGMILDTGRNVENLSVSPDGRYISYSEPGFEGDRIVIYDRYTEEFVGGPEGFGNYASWSPDSRKIVFVRRSSITEHDTNCRLMTFDLDTGDTRILY